MAPEDVGSVVVESSADAICAIGRFERFPKLLGWLILHAAGLPALPGIVITAWDARVVRDVERYAGHFASTALLLRSDSASETGRSPRGGYLVGLADVEGEARELIDQGRAVFLLEPASPFDDLYSVCLEPDSAWRQWELEVVGAGFDASDLKRGDVTPHERIRAMRDEHGVVLESRVVAADEVQATVRAIRLKKVAAMLKSSPHDVERELRRLGDTMLLENSTYRPIPEAFLATALDLSARLRPELVRRRLRDRGISISLGFLGPDARLVFWDVVWPQSKYTVGDG